MGSRAASLAFSLTMRALDVSRRPSCEAGSLSSGFLRVLRLRATMPSSSGSTGARLTAFEKSYVTSAVGSRFVAPRSQRCLLSYLEECAPPCTTRAFLIRVTFHDLRPCLGSNRLHSLAHAQRGPAIGLPASPALGRRASGTIEEIVTMRELAFGIEAFLVALLNPHPAPRVR